jgi:hypothetical protein
MLRSDIRCNSGNARDVDGSCRAKISGLSGKQSSPELKKLFSASCERRDIGVRDSSTILETAVFVLKHMIGSEKCALPVSNQYFDGTSNPGDREQEIVQTSEALTVSSLDQMNSPWSFLY